jgi:hypothetical protein
LRPTQIGDTYATFEDKHHVYMVAEYIEVCGQASCGCNVSPPPVSRKLLLDIAVAMQGCDLFEYVADAPDGPNDHDIHDVVEQLLAALSYLHDQDIAHREYACMPPTGKL